MNMRLENVRDRKTRFPRHVDVDVAVRPRIENCTDAFVIVAQQIGKFRDAFGLDRFKDERHRLT